MSRKRVLRQAMIALVIVVALVCGLALTACSVGDATYISLESTGISLDVGASKEITPKLESDKVKSEDITYQISLGSDVIKLEGNKVTGLKAGVAQIKVAYKTSVILIEVKVNGKDLTIEELRGLIAELDGKLTASNAAIDQITKDLEAANGTAGKLGEAVEKLKTDLAAAQTSIADLTRELAAVKADLESSVEELNAKIAGLNTAINANADALKAIQDSIAAYKAADAGVAGVVKALYDEFAVYQDKKTTDYMASEWKVLEGKFYYYLSYITRSSSVEAAQALLAQAKTEFKAVETKSQSIIGLIDDIGTTIYFIPDGMSNPDLLVDSEAAIKAAQSAFDSADKNTQNKIPAASQNLLKNADDTYKALKALYKKAESVDALIGALSSKSASEIDAAITAANKAYTEYIAEADKLDYEIDDKAVVTAAAADDVTTVKYTYNYVTKKTVLDDALAGQTNAKALLGVLSAGKIFKDSEKNLAAAKTGIAAMTATQKAFFGIYTLPVVADLDANIAVYKLINADFAALKDNAAVDAAIKSADDEYTTLSGNEDITNYISSADKVKLGDLKTVSKVAKLIMAIKTPIDETSQEAYETAKTSYSSDIGSSETKQSYFAFYTFESFDNYKMAIELHAKIAEWNSLDATENYSGSKALAIAITEAYDQINDVDNAVAKSFVSKPDLDLLANMNLAAKAANDVVNMMDNQTVLVKATYTAEFAKVTASQTAIAGNEDATAYFAKFTGLDKVADIAAAVDVMDKIVAIGNVDINADALDEALHTRITAARAAYDALKKSNETVLTGYIGAANDAANYDILYNAEKDYQTLEGLVKIKEANSALENAMTDAMSRTNSAEIKNSISVAKADAIKAIANISVPAYDATYEAFDEYCASIDEAVNDGINAMYQCLKLQPDNGTDSAYTVYAEYGTDAALTKENFGGKDSLDQLTIFFSVADGDVYLSGVNVARLIVNGGGMNSVHITDCVITDMVIARAEGTVKVHVAGKSKVTNVEVSNTAILDVSADKAVTKVVLAEEAAGVSFTDKTPDALVIPGVAEPITGKDIPKFTVSTTEQLFNAAFAAKKGDVIVVNGGVYEFDTMLYLGTGNVANGDPYNAGKSFNNAGVIIRGNGEVVFTPSQKFVDTLADYESEPYRMHLVQIGGNYNSDAVTLENITIKNSCRAGLNLYAANASIKNVKVIVDGNGYKTEDGADPAVNLFAAVIVNQSKLVVDGITTEGNYEPFDIDNGKNAQYDSVVTLNGTLSFNSRELLGRNTITYSFLNDGKACSVINAKDFTRTMTSLSATLYFNEEDIAGIKTEPGYYPVAAVKEGEGNLYAKDFSTAVKYATKGSTITAATVASSSKDDQFGFSTSVTSWWSPQGSNEKYLDMSFSFAKESIDFNKLTSITFKLFDKNGALIATALSNDKINSTEEGKTLVGQLIAESVPYFPEHGNSIASIPFRFRNETSTGSCWQFTAATLEAGAAIEGCYFELEMVVDGNTYKTTSIAHDVPAYVAPSVPTALAA